MACHTIINDAHETEVELSRKPKNPRTQPRARQARPTISFRTDRTVLSRLDYLADRFGVTRNEVMERVFRLYLTERGDDVEAMLATAGATDERPLDIFG